MCKQVSISLIMALAVIFLAAESASAYLIHRASQYDDYAANANPSVGAILRTDSSSSLSSAIKINEEWSLMTLHQIENAGEPDTVTYGGNAFTTPVSSTIDYWVANPDGYDLVLAHHATPITNAPNATIGDRLEVGDDIHYTGFGIWGTDYHPIGQTGDALGVDGRLDSWGFYSIFSTDYFASTWRKPTNPLAYELGGLGQSGDSGGGVFDDNGFLIGIATSITATFNSYNISTVFLDLTAEDRRNWIEETTRTGVPETGLFLLLQRKSEILLKQLRQKDHINHKKLLVH